MVAVGDVGGDEGATPLGGFHHDGGVGEGCYDAVACGEVSGFDFGVQWVFGYQGTARFDDVFGEEPVLAGVDGKRYGRDKRTKLYI